jgi:dethiobiotin synthetase
MRCFITATGTGIGKTYITAGITGALRGTGQSVRAVKPVISGYEDASVATSDTGLLLQAMGLPLHAENIEACSPWRFTAPLSPDMAAAREGRSVDFDALVDWSRAALAGPQDHVLIEGVGGVMVPLDASRTVLDWIAALDIPVLLVAGSYLGTLSHTLTALEVLRMRGVPVWALAINESEGEFIFTETLNRFTGDAQPIKIPKDNTNWLGVINHIHKIQDN